METITEANKKNIRRFAYEAFSDILSVRLTDVSENRRQILQNVIKILSEEFNGKMIYFTKDIFKSVCVTHVMLKEYFAPFFTLNLYNPFRSTFINDFKLVLLHWLQQRDNVFVKIIDSLAIITEAYLFCLYFKEFPSNIKNTTEGLINLFEEIFPSEFFHKGGWGRLTEKAEMWYQNLYSEYCIKEIVVDYCKCVSFLRESTVMFPVPEHWLCEKCKIPQDEIMTRQITYVIPDYDFLNALDNKILGEICSDLEKVSVEKRIDCVKNEDHFVEKENNTYVERKYSSDTGKEYVGAVIDPEKLLEREKESVITVKCSVDLDDNSTNSKIGTIDAGKNYVDKGKHSVDDGKHTTHDKKDPEVGTKDPEGDEKVPEDDEKVPEDDEKVPEGDEKVPEGDEKVSKGDEKVSKGDEKVPKGDEKVTVKADSQNLNFDKKYTVPIKVTLNVDKKINNLKCESAGKEFIDTGKVSSDAEKQPIEMGNASYNSKKNLLKGKQRNKNYNKDKETVQEVIHSTVAAVSKKPYNSESTLEMNHNLLEELIGKACKTDRTENNDFWFIAEKYSHSVEKMLKEVFSLQSTNIVTYSDIIQKVKTACCNIPNLDEGFFFSMAYVFVSIGGTKNKTKRGSKNRKKKLLKEL